MTNQVKEIQFLDPLKVVAFQDRIIVLPDETEEITLKSGLILTASQQEEKRRGTIILVGNEVTENVEIGMKVVYGKFSGQQLEINDVKYQCVRPSECMVAYHEGLVESDLVLTRQKATMQA